MLVNDIMNVVNNKMTLRMNLLQLTEMFFFFFCFVNSFYLLRIKCFFLNFFVLIINLLYKKSTFKPINTSNQSNSHFLPIYYRSVTDSLPMSYRFVTDFLPICY